MKLSPLKIFFVSTLFIFVSQISKAQGDNKIDTLILNDNTVLIGQIDNLYQVITQDGNAARREFKIDTAWGKRIDVPVHEVKYVKAFGTTFERVELNSNVHQLMEIVSAGKVTLYLWRKISIAPGASVVNSFNDNKVFKPSTGMITDSEVETYMILVKDKWEDVTASFVKRKFSELFGDCPKLVQEAKSKDFNYKAIGKIVKEYNGCF